MEGNPQDLTTAEIEERIIQLENTYAEILGNSLDTFSLSTVWLRIKELKGELSKRTNSF